MTIFWLMVAVGVPVQFYDLFIGNGRGSWIGYATWVIGMLSNGLIRLLAALRGHDVRDR